MKIKLFGVLMLVASVYAVGALAGTHTTGVNKPTVVYVAHLHPINAKIAGHETTGEARFTVSGDTLTIRVKTRGLPPGMMHMQHLHGFKNGRHASCATEAADVNGDGVVDVVETEPASGITMVPLSADPVSMKVATGTYPKASAEGVYRYKETVSLQALEAAFAKSFPGQKLDLARRVVYIHGVLPNVKLPASVASLGTIPAQVTLPIACGNIERIAP
jgi:hypothetical protein